MKFTDALGHAPEYEIIRIADDAREEGCAQNRRIELFVEER